jgi:hypothetical protein
MVGLSTATWRYQRQPDPTNTQLLERLLVYAAGRPRFGYRRLHTLVDREGLHVNHKRVYGVYREAGLQVRRRRRKRLTRGQRVALPVPSRRSERWPMDFMVDMLAGGVSSARSTSSMTSPANASPSKSTDPYQACASSAYSINWRRRAVCLTRL